MSITNTLFRDAKLGVVSLPSVFESSFCLYNHSPKPVKKNNSSMKKIIGTVSFGRKALFLQRQQKKRTVI